VTLPYSIGFLFTKNVRLPMVLASVRKKYDHYFVLMTEGSSHLFQDQRIFYFQLKTKLGFDRLIEENWEQICEFEQVYGLSFVYQKYLMENINLLDKKIKNYNFLKKVAQMTQKEYHDEIVCLTFANQPLDSACIVRKFDDRTL